MRLRYLPTFLCIVVVFVVEHAFAQADPMSFEREILPLLEKRCNECHHPAGTDGGLDLTQRSTMISGGDDLGPVIVPGKPNVSPLVQVLHEGGEYFMPKDGDPLEKDEIALLKKWIAEGARDNTPSFNDDEIAFFEREVRPILFDGCLKCHAGKDAESGLQLTSRHGILAGGDRGPAVVLGNPAGIDKVLENCRWDYDYGYRQFKVKIGRGNRWMPAKAGLKRDIDVVNAIHKAFPDVEILVDGNNGFTVETMIGFLDGIADVPVFWIEEPFHETVADWTRLRDYLVANGRKETLRADGEAKPDFPVLEELQQDHTLNVRLEDICGHGFTRWRQQLPRLTKEGIGVSPHTWGTALKTVYTAHFVGAYGNAPTIEGVTTKGGDVDFGENRIVDAQFHPSNQPGFGLALPAQ